MPESDEAQFGSWRLVDLIPTAREATHRPRPEPVQHPDLPRAEVPARRSLPHRDDDGDDEDGDLRFDPN